MSYRDKMTHQEAVTRPVVEGVEDDEQFICINGNLQVATENTGR
jgi:hypothetical protein